jgi:hypothetical protein
MADEADRAGDQLHQHLTDAKERLLRRDRLRGLLEQARNELERQKGRLEALEEQVRSEARDVERLEGLSLAALVHSVLGDRTRRTIEERDELLEATLKRDQCRDGVRALREEIAGLRSELKKMGDPETDYRRLLAEKEDRIRQSGGPAAEELLDLTDELGHCRAQLAELQQAIDAGNTAAHHLQGVITALQSAGNWGVWDALGGGLISTAVKHSRIDDAREAAHRAEHWLGRFRRELSDVALRVDDGWDVEMSGFTRFADYFFDGLIADLFVQSKVRRSQESAARALRQVRETVEMLREAMPELKERAAGLQQERQRLVEETPGS